MKANYAVISTDGNRIALSTDGGGDDARARRLRKHLLGVSS